MKYDTVIFDLDGTLLYTLDDLTDCVNYTMELFGYPRRTLEEVRSFVGNGIEKLVRRCLPTEVSEERFGEVFKKFKNYYTDNCQRRTRPYEGILELIAGLKEMGIKMAIVSNKNHMAVQELNRTYFQGRIDVAIGDRPGFNRKPAADSVNEALKELGSTRERALYVGDSEVDIKTAANAGMRNILVTWGFRDKEQLVEAGGLEFIDKPEELIALLKTV